MARFHTYGFGNVMLIARQKPDATHVAGFRTWNSLGRFVKPGEKGILILAPMIGRKKAGSRAELTEDAKVGSRPAVHAVADDGSVGSGWGRLPGESDTVILGFLMTAH